jgi:transcriptional regulator with XRE-family HTH domain
MGDSMSADTEAKQRLGRAIRSLRETKDLSRRTLSSRARLTVKTLRDIERGQRSPREHTLQQIARGLGVDAENLLSSPEAPAGLHAAGDAVTAPIAIGSAVLSPDALGAQLLLLPDHKVVGLMAQFARNALMMNRREMIQAAASTMLMGIGSADALASLQYGLEGRKVGGEIAVWAHEQIGHLSRLDDLVGGKQLYKTAQSNLDLLQHLLQTRVVSKDDEQGLRLAVARAASQAGWFAHDAERRDMAIQHFRFGLEMARSAGDTDFAAYCMMRVASLTIAKGNPSQGLAQLQAAEAEAGEQSPLRSLILNFMVEAQAAMGDYKTAAATLARADAIYDARNMDALPDWLYWLPQPSLTDLNPPAFLPHDPRFAARLAEEALAQTSTEYVRSRMVLLVELAKARHALGDTDEAVDRAEEVLHAVERTEMPRVEKYLSEFSRSLPDDPVTRSFKQRITEFQHGRDNHHFLQ